MGEIILGNKMKKIWKYISIGLIICGFTLPLKVRANDEKHTPNACIIISTEDLDMMKKTVEYVNQQGGEVVHIFPTHVAIGYVSKELGLSLIGKYTIENVYYQYVDPNLVKRYGEQAVSGVNSWNANFAPGTD